MAPSAFSLADALGLPRSALLRWTVVASVPVAYYLVSRKRSASKPQERADFDAFLQTVEPAGSTGASKKKGPTSGSIDAFFLDAGETKDTRNPTDFSTFLLDNGAASAPTQQNHAVKEQEAAPSADQVQVLVMYGTEYGFSKEIAEKLCSQLRATGKYWPVLRDMADCDEGYDFSREQAVFMACSTQGDGVPPTEAREFCEWLFAGKAGSLSHLKYAVCALGDRSYTHFCRCGQQLDAALAQAGAVQLVARPDVNREDWPVVDAWMQAVLAALGAQQLQTIGSMGGSPSSEPAAAASKHAAAKKHGKSRPYLARVVALEPLCSLSGKDDKNTFRAELDLGDSGISYVPGDALGIYPTNAPQGVADLLTALGASASQLVARPSWHYEEQGMSYEGGQMPLGDALAKCYDLRSPKPELLKLLLAALPTPASANGHTAANGHAAGANGHAASANGHAATANGHGDVPGGAAAAAARLAAVLADTASIDAYLALRHVVDVLLDFPAAHLSVVQVLGALRQLQPRLYSISSSPLEHPQRVQVTVAEVRYQALGRERIGVCSTYVSERLQVGSAAPVYVHRNPDFRLPPSPATPILMVGPGTGLAPFRSFILERLLQQQQQQQEGGAGLQAAVGEMVLYFGCRRSDQDYLYGPLLEGWAREGKITLHTAFSRQQAQKVYVQQRLAESADAVWRLLQAGGHFYVCGDASSMAGQVEEALLHIIQERLPQAQGPLEQEPGQVPSGRAGAEAYLKAMADSGRYQRDVWY